MGKTWTLSLNLACSSLLFALTLVEGIEWCPVALEGLNFSLPCIIKTPDNVQSFVKWEIQNTTNLSNVVTLCEWKNGPCDTVSKKEYQITNNLVEKMSNFTFLNVSTLHRGLTLTCKVWIPLKNREEVVSSCKMAVYRPGKSANCSSQLQDDGKIRLYCFSNGVYPEIACQFTETIDGLRTYYQKTMQAYHQIVTSERFLLYNSSCEAFTFPMMKGKYSYEISIRPGYPHGEMTATILNAIVQVNTSRRVQVSAPEKVSLCPNTSTIAPIVCEAQWFRNTTPMFKFLFDKTEAKKLGTLNRSGNDYNYYAQFGVPLQKKFFGSMMICKVGIDESLMINDSKRLSFSYPPNPLVFKNGTIRLSNYLYITKGENITLQCSSDGGHPTVTSINVTCYNNSEVAIVNVSANNSNSVLFTVVGNETFNNVRCLCVSQHVTPCNQGKVIIFFIVMSRGQGRTPHEKVWNNITPIYYIIMATLALMFLPMIVATCLFIRNNGHLLYEYYYSTDFYKKRHSMKPKGPPLPPPRIPQRLNSNPKASSDQQNNRNGFLPPVPPRSPIDDGQWMEDPNVVLPDHLLNRDAEPPCRRKHKKKKALMLSTSSDDYLLPITCRKPENNLTETAFTSGSEYGESSILNSSQFNDSYKKFSSLGFAPFQPASIRDTASGTLPLKLLETGNTEVKSLEKQESEYTHPKTIAHSTKTNPIRYVKTGHKPQSSETEALLLSTGSPESSLVDTSSSDHDLDQVFSLEDISQRTVEKTQNIYVDSNLIN